jgi:hypothetical protein
MPTVRGKVQNGRLVVDEPTDLPEGQVVELVVVMDHDEDDLDEAQRAALHAALADAQYDIDRGRLVDGDPVLDRLRARQP